MSAEATAWAKRVKTGDATRKAILRALADYAGPGKADRDAPAEADGRHFTFVGLETLAEECECSERTIVRHLNALKAAGSIVRVRRMRGFIRTSDYTVLAVDGYGPRPFTDAEALLADGLDSVDDNLTSTGPTSEDAILSPSVDDTLAPTGTCHPKPPKVTRVSPTEHDTGVTCVPYAGTTSNYEPSAEPPAGGAREVALIERDEFSPGFLTPLSGDVLSLRTAPAVANYRADVNRVVDEIISGYAGWVERETGQKLTGGDLHEIRNEVKAIMIEDPSNEQRRAALSVALRQWTRKGMHSVKVLRGFVRTALTEAVQTEDRKPSKAEQRFAGTVKTALSVAGKTTAQLSAEFEEGMRAMVAQSNTLGYGSKLAIEGGTA